MRIMRKLSSFSYILFLSCLLTISACGRISDKKIDSPKTPAQAAPTPTPTPAIPADPSKLEFAPLKFSPPAPEVVTLSNGMKVYLYEDHELPLVTVKTKTRVGSIYEPEAKIGLAGLCGEVMRTGGTKKWSGDELDAKLEFMAAELGNSIGQESGEAGLDVRKQDLETGLAMLADMLRNPRFEKSKIEIGREQRLEAIRRRNDNPSSIAGREFMRILYGKSSPWARIAQPQTIRAITRKDLVDFHAKYYQPTNTMLGIAGDFNKQEALALLEKYFDDWKKKEIEFPKVPPVDQNVKPGVYVVERDAPQSTVLIGHFGYRRLDPMQLSLTLFNELFGAGGFSSRLMREVRSNRGLAYSTYGSISKGTDVGTFVMSAETQAPSTVESARVMLDEMRKVTVGPITHDELDRARSSEVNSFVFPFESPSEIVSLRMDLDFYSYPSDWLQTYVDRIGKVTEGDVLASAQKFLHPDNVIVLVVGDPAKFGAPLSELGLGEPKPVQLDPVE